MSRPLDLDNLTPQQLDELGLADLERLWGALERRAAARQADPALREAILRRLEEGVAAGRVSRGRAAAIKHELEHAHPAAVLDGHVWELLDRHKPTIGAFPRATDVGELYRREPVRLVNYLREASRFSQDEDRVLQAAADFAELVGIDDKAAEDALVEGLKAIRAERRQRGAGRAG